MRGPLPVFTKGKLDPQRPTFIYFAQAHQYFADQMSKSNVLWRPGVSKTKQKSALAMSTLQTVIYRLSPDIFL